MVTAGMAAQRVGIVAGQIASTIRTTQKRFESVAPPGAFRPVARFSAHGSECAAEQPRRPPDRAMRIQANRQALYHALAPAALGHEQLVLLIHKVFGNQAMPVAEVHAVVLPDPEAL